VRGTPLALVLLCACGSYTPLDSHYNKGVEFYDQGRLGDAIREYRLALEDDPENYRARYNLAVAYHDQGKKDDAAREYLEVLKLHPDNARARVSLASIRAEEGKDDVALRLLEEAAAADRHSAFPKESLGSFYERKGDLDRALAAYRDAARIEPDSSSAHAGIGRLLARRGAFQDAVAEYDKALAADGNDPATLLAASEAREQVGDLKAAMLLLERALVHLKDRAPLWVRLARLYEGQGRLEDAVASLWEAREIEPANKDVGPRLKALYEKLAAKER
jgi:tetratricopeptide (TPR) repeat protein